MIDATSSAPSFSVHVPFSVPPSATLSVVGVPSATAATISTSGWSSTTVTLTVPVVTSPSVSVAFTTRPVIVRLSASGAFSCGKLSDKTAVTVGVATSPPPAAVTSPVSVSVITVTPPILPSSVRPLASPTSSVQTIDAALSNPETVGLWLAAKLSEIASDPDVKDNPVLLAVSPVPPGVEPVPLRSNSSTVSDAVPEAVASAPSVTVMVCEAESTSPSPSVAVTVNDTTGGGVESTLLLAAKLQVPVALIVSVPVARLNTAGAPPGSVTNLSG